MAAVTVRPRASGTTTTEVLKKAKEGVSLEDLGIKDTRIRKTANGSLLIEIPGTGSSGKADVLAEQLRRVLGDEAVVSRPSVKGDLRLVGLDESVTVGEIGEAVCREAGCQPSEVRVGRVGVTRGGLGTV